MLLIHSASDPHSGYSHYLAEILRGEGFADFVETDISALDAETVASHDLVVLPRLSATYAQTEMFVRYVEQGGRLVAFSPDPVLAARLGLKPTFKGLDAGYLHLDAGQSMLKGLCMEPIQVIVTAIGWEPAQGSEVTVLAQVRSERESDGSQALPAIVLSRSGQGEALLFAFDLPRAIARLRQGDPAHADLHLAGLDGVYRPSELFVGQLDPQQVYLPQADLHTALLARLIETLAPRPRLWYYPQAEQRSTMIMTSDDDWSTLDQFETLLAGMRRRGIHCTFYVVPGTHLTRDLMDRWEAEGHTFSVHPTISSDTTSGLLGREPQTLFLTPMLQENVARHIREFGRTPATIRQHAVRWLGYVDAARVQTDLGVRMDLNYVSVYPFSLGYMAGSGRPLRFVESDGTIVPCLQQPTLWTEETLIHPEMVFSFRWTVARALDETGQIIRRAARDFYTPVAINSHPVSFATYSSPLVEGVWDVARAEGMPIISADEWLRWTEGRDAVRLTPETAGFTLNSAHRLPSIVILLPAGASPQAEGSAVSQVRLWGREYTALTLNGIAAGESRRVTL